MPDDREAKIPEIAAALPPEYQLATPEWEPAAHSSVVPVGSGGSSLVLPALFRGRLRRALKVFLPRPDLRERLDMTHFVESYDNEVGQQATLSHENISKITDFASIELGDGQYPFIATEYVNGRPLQEFAESPGVSGDAILKVLQDVLHALQYLHSHNVMHCDIKQDNILVCRHAEGHSDYAVLVDLGSSRHFPSPDADKEDELLHLFTTTRYVPPGLQYVVSNWTENRISRRNLRRHFPYLDLHAVGVILQDFLGNDVVQDKLARVTGQHDLAAIKHIRGRLNDPKPGPKHFQSAGEVSDAIDRVSRKNLAPLGVAELGPPSSRGVVIPGMGSRIHGSGRVDRIMSHPLFQRFHLLPQLDLLYWTMPGATHSRYVHAAHSYELARQAVSFMLDNWRIRQEITKEDIETTIFSALLNPMGHYHFLHMFEDFIEVRASVKMVESTGVLRDDELIDSVLGLSENSIGARLATIKDERGRSLPQVVESLGLDWSVVRRRQRDPENPLQGVLAALLSGPLDVEKLAYLRDDSQATGLQFGAGLDGSPIFESIVMPREIDWRAQGGVHGVALGVTERAVSYLEYGVLTRYWNIQTAYWHRINRAIQAMVKFQIASLMRAGSLDFEAYVADSLHFGIDGALRWLNSRFVRAQVEGDIDPETVNPIAELLESRRVIYKRLLTISGKSAIAGRDPDYRIYRQVQAQSPLEDHVVHQLVKSALQSVAPTLDVKPGEVLLDLPRVPRDETTGRVLVYTDDTAEFMGELFQISPNLHQHQQSFEQYVKRMRIFLHPRVYGHLLRNGLESRAHKATLDALRVAYAS